MVATRTCLNPCCNGIYSMRRLIAAIPMLAGLNPCCNGIYSMSSYVSCWSCSSCWVLILVVMEYTQWAYVSCWSCSSCVLILVVMEYTQWGIIAYIYQIIQKSLNPCCNGIYSMSYRVWFLKNLWVLILVVMEYTQWE